MFSLNRNNEIGLIPSISVHCKHKSFHRLNKRNIPLILYKLLWHIIYTNFISKVKQVRLHMYQFKCIYMYKHYSYGLVEKSTLVNWNTYLTKRKKHLFSPLLRNISKDFHSFFVCQWFLQSEYLWIPLS